jgi:hypothetical protein
MLCSLNALGLARLALQLKVLAVREGSALPVHTSFKAVRPVEDGPLDFRGAPRAKSRNWPPKAGPRCVAFGDHQNPIRLRARVFGMVTFVGDLRRSLRRRVLEECAAWSMTHE